MTRRNSTPGRYRAKDRSFQFRAMQWDGSVDAAFEIFVFVTCDCQVNDDGTATIHMFDRVPLLVEHDDWIATLGGGKYSVVKPDTFARKFEVAD